MDRAVFCKYAIRHVQLPWGYLWKRTYRAADTDPADLYQEGESDIWSAFVHSA